MELLILFGLAAAVLVTAVLNLLPSQPHPPQVIYIQMAPTEYSPTGCLPLALLIGAILLGIALA